MRVNSTVQQVLQALNSIKMIGESKHAAKQDFSAKYAGNKAIDDFMHQFGKNSGIYSDQTFKDYLQKSIEFAKFVKETFKVKDISKINEEHAKAFLDSKVQAGLAKSSIQSYSSALEKFEQALSVKYQKSFNLDIKAAISDKVKESLQIKERAGYHPYVNPKALVENIKNNPNISAEHKLVVSITYESGVRTHKAIAFSGIKINADYSISTVGKGGRINELRLTENTKAELMRLSNNGVFKLTDRDYKKILKELKQASAETKQVYEALHGFRKSNALEMLNEVKEGKMTMKEYNNRMYHGEQRFVGAYGQG